MEYARRRRERGKGEGGEGKRGGKRRVERGR